MPELCLQCSVYKDKAVKNCTFHGWGTPCGPCDASHVSSCEYYLHAACRGEARDLIRQRVAIHVPSGKYLSGTYHFYDKIQASACTTFWTLPGVIMKWERQGKPYEMCFISCQIISYVFHSYPATNFNACPGIFHFYFIPTQPLQSP